MLNDSAAATLQLAAAINNLADAIRGTRSAAAAPSSGRYQDNDGDPIPAGFPTAELIEWANQQYPACNIAREAERFRKRYSDSGERRKNWPQVWMRWMDTARPTEQRASPPPIPAEGRPLDPARRAPTSEEAEVCRRVLGHVPKHVTDELMERWRGWAAEKQRRLAKWGAPGDAQEKIAAD